MICQWHESPSLTIPCAVVDGGFSMVLRKFCKEMRNGVLRVSFLVYQVFWSSLSKQQTNPFESYVNRKHHHNNKEVLLSDFNHCLQLPKLHTDIKDVTIKV